MMNLTALPIINIPIARMQRLNASNAPVFCGALPDDTFEKNNQIPDNPLKYIQERFPDTKDPITEEYLSGICEAIKRNDNDSKNIIKLINYASKNNIQYDILMDLPPCCKVNENLLAQIDKKDKTLRVFSNDNEASDNVEIGDVYAIAGEKFAKIKVSESNSKQLKISPQMYMKLFSPVEKHAVTQNFSGDCYLLAVLGAAMNKPEARALLLSSFEQSGDDVIVRFPGGTYEHKFKNAKISDEIDTLRLSKSCPGIMMLEHTYGHELEELNANSPAGRADLDDINATLPQYVPPYKEKADYFRDKGGEIARAVKFAGFINNFTYNLADNFGMQRTVKFLTEPGDWSDKIILASSDSRKNPTTEKHGIKQHHAYVIEPKVQGEKIIYKVYNSSNSAFYTEMNLDEMMQSFDYIFTGKII